MMDLRKIAPYPQSSPRRGEEANAALRANRHG